LVGAHTAERLVGLIAAVLILIGAGLDFLQAFDPLPRRLTVDEVSRVLLPAALGIVALIAAVVMFKSRYRPGGVIAVAVGVGLALAPSGNLSAGILIAIGGVLGYVASELK